MGKIKTVIKIITDSDFRFHCLANKGLKSKTSAEEFLKKEYKFHMGQELDLDHPQKYTEKLQWLKLYDHRPQYTTMVDKYMVKQYVSDRIGEEYVIPLLGVWDRVDDIDFSSLPEKFVLKTTHDSGGLVICKDKSKLNLKAAKKKIEKSLNRNFYYVSREWPYSQVKPRIIAEQYMEDDFGELRDYKYYCFDGEMKIMLIAYDRFSGNGAKLFYCDKDYNNIELTWGHKAATGKIEKPEKFEEMIEMAEKLSVGMPQVRVDFYLVGGQIYFGELTLYDGGGFDVITPYERDLELGAYIKLPQKKD